MKRNVIIVCAVCLLTQLVFAEGTRQLAPNADAGPGFNNTSDIAALHIDSDNYNNFAAYSNPNPNSRLNIHIADPSAECIYLGFSVGHQNITGLNPPLINYEYRILDPNGNIVFGPVTVNAGSENVNNWSEAFDGPSQLVGASGYNAIVVNSSDLMSQGWSGAGDYYIQFQHFSTADGFLIDFWDITVADCFLALPLEKKGRVWSKNWAIFAINDFGFPNRPFNGSFYVCAPDPANPDAAFVTLIDFNGSGFRPAAFNLAFNSFGAQNTGDISIDRRSVESFNGTQPEYAIFLNDPVEICETGVTGEIELLGIGRCDPSEYVIKFVTTKAGQIDLILDFDGPDDVYTPGSADILISRTVNQADVGLPFCVSWDGLDGLGNSLVEDSGTQIPAHISFAQGIYHFPIFDAEYMINGFNIQAVRPPGPEPLLYYDDSGISASSDSGEPATQLAGCMLPCHRWINYTGPAIVGFGNLNTINSWWFSQQVITKEFMVMPRYMECNVDGPPTVCQGGTETIIWQPEVFPSGLDAPEVVEVNWSGPGIVGSNNTDQILINSAGMYAVNISWLSEIGDTCSSSCGFNIDQAPPAMHSIDTLIRMGDTIVVNGEILTNGGQYTQMLITGNGCDSILIINVFVAEPEIVVIHYDLDDCLSRPFDGTSGDYSEFTPQYPNGMSCGAVGASIVSRSNPSVNQHSCTPGVGNSPAMCVGALNSCVYDASSEKAVKIRVSVVPGQNEIVSLSGLQFYEKAPLNFDWIQGDAGLNNYPTLYGIRILRSGVEVFREEGIPTTQGWSLESFDFFYHPAFVVNKPTMFHFEFLAYCPVGNDADVMAWDLDEISIKATCVTMNTNDQLATAPGLAHHEVAAYTSDGNIDQTPPFGRTDISGSNSTSAHLENNILFQNVPNPFSNETSISFKLAEAQPVVIDFFDASGQLLKSISETYDAGIRTVEIAAADLGVKSGLVLYRLRGENFTATKRMFLVVK